MKISVEADASARMPVHTVYLTVGVYTVQQTGGASSWKVLRAGKVIVPISAHSVRVSHNGWYSVQFEAGRGPEGSAQLLLLTRNGD